MALSINIPTQYGVDATYFKVVDVKLNTLLNKGSLILSGFYDKAARDRGDKCLLVKNYEFEDVEYEQFFNLIVLNQENVNPVLCGYNFIVTTDVEYKDATFI